MKKQKDPACFKCWDKGFSTQWANDDVQITYCECPAAEAAKAKHEKSGTGKQAKLI